MKKEDLIKKLKKIYAQLILIGEIEIANEIADIIERFDFS